MTPMTFSLYIILSTFLFFFDRAFSIFTEIWYRSPMASGLPLFLPRILVISLIYQASILSVPSSNIFFFRLLSQYMQFSGYNLSMCFQFLLYCFPPDHLPILFWNFFLYCLRQKFFIFPPVFAYVNILFRSTHVFFTFRYFQCILF